MLACLGNKLPSSASRCQSYMQAARPWCGKSMIRGSWSWSDPPLISRRRSVLCGMLWHLPAVTSRPNGLYLIWHQIDSTLRLHLRGLDLCLFQILHAGKQCQGSHWIYGRIHWNQHSSESFWRTYFSYNDPMCICIDGVEHTAHWVLVVQLQTVSVQT
jgi:hypothetical protein